MKYWLIAYLFDVEGQFIAKDIYETASFEQCEKFAGDYARIHVNTQLQMQLHCISDEDYRLEIGDDK